ncbi:hypothetical protein Hanom_Chr01g00092751 [Helianthus anomalus]
MSGGPPSLSSVRKPAASSSSSGNTTGNNKPVSFQRPINQTKAPSHGDVDPRAKNSTTQPGQSGDAAK